MVKIYFIYLTFFLLIYIFIFTSENKQDVSGGLWRWKNQVQSINLKKQQYSKNAQKRKKTFWYKNAFVHKENTFNVMWRERQSA